MTLKQKLESAKAKVQENYPAVIGILTAAVAIISSAYIYEKTKSSDEITLEMTREDFEDVKAGYINMTYYLDGELFDVSCRGKNPDPEDD